MQLNRTPSVLKQMMKDALFSIMTATQTLLTSALSFTLFINRYLYINNEKNYNKKILEIKGKNSIEMQL